MLNIKKGDRLVRFSRHDGLPMELTVKEVIKMVVSEETEDYLIAGMDRYKIVATNGNTYRLDGTDGEIFKLSGESSFIKLKNE